MPEKDSPSSARATWPPRDIRIKKTVTRLVTATHSQARLPPSRQLVSSRCATRCASMESRASCTGSAITSVVVCSDWLIEPTLMGTPNRSAITCCVVRLDKRYDPLHSATVACTRGPYVPLGMPAGQGARVVSPQAGHTNWCHWYSVITGWMGGISRGVVELLLECTVLLLQRLDHGLQGGHTCLKRDNISPHFGWCLFPEALW